MSSGPRPSPLAPVPPRPPPAPGPLDRSRARPRPQRPRRPQRRCRSPRRSASRPARKVFRKLRIVAADLNILIHRRIWNWRPIDYSTMQYAMSVAIRDIRGKNAEDLAALLHQRLVDDDETFASNKVFRLHGTNARQTHRVLARMTEYVEVRSGLPSACMNYAKRGGKGRSKSSTSGRTTPSATKAEFSHPNDFAEYGNRIGDLLLLPKSFNASYGDLLYEKKLVHYDSQNLLARSLGPNAYDHNPGFRQFIESSGLPFKPHPVFQKSDLDDRQELYRLLAEQIWSPTPIEEAASA